MSESFTKTAINLDANASYGLLPEVWEECVRVAGTYANPSSIHQAGQKGRSLIESARSEVLALLGNPSNCRVVFTSGATEASALLLHAGLRKRGGSALTLEVEHPATLENLAHFAAIFGVEIRHFPVNKISEISNSVNENTRLVSIMAANNESGELYPVADVFKKVKATFANVLCHTDAVQCPGKVPLDFAALHCDAVTLSGHKMGAMMGVGALIIEDSIEAYALLRGGAQESRWRAGTENVLGIHSLGVAARLARIEQEDRAVHMLAIRNRIIGALEREFSDCIVLFKERERLPNTISVRFPGISADDLVVALDLESVCISAGSACASGKPLASHVLLASGLSDSEAREVVRISVPHTLTEADVTRAIESLLSCLKRMQVSRENAA